MPLMIRVPSLSMENETGTPSTGRDGFSGRWITSGGRGISVFFWAMRYQDVAMRGAGRAVFSTCTSAAHSSGFRAGIEVLPPAGVGDPGDRDQPEPVFLGNKFCTAVRAVKVVIGRRDAEQPFSGYLTENAGSADRAPGEPRVRFPAGIRGTAGQDVSRSDVPRPGRMQPDTPDLRMGGGIGHLGRLCKAGVDKNFGNDRCDSALIAAKAFDEAFTQPREEGTGTPCDFTERQRP